MPPALSISCSPSGVCVCVCVAVQKPGQEWLWYNMPGFVQKEKIARFLSV